MFRTRTGRGSIQLLAEIQVGRSGGLHGHSPGPEAATAAADLGLGHGTYMLVRISLSSLTNCQ